jgi:hypothetical protein
MMSLFNYEAGGKYFLPALSKLKSGWFSFLPFQLFYLSSIK